MKDSIIGLTVIFRKNSEIRIVIVSHLHQLQGKKIQKFDFEPDCEPTTPTTLDFSKELRDRERYRKSTTSTTGPKKFKDSILGPALSQLHQLHWIFRKNSKIESVTASQLHQLQGKKN